MAWAKFRPESGKSIVQVSREPDGNWHCRSCYETADEVPNYRLPGDNDHSCVLCGADLLNAPPAAVLLKDWYAKDSAETKPEPVRSGPIMYNISTPPAGATSPARPGSPQLAGSEKLFV